MQNVSQDTQPESADDYSFDQLDPKDQNVLIRYLMQGKPQTPQNMNAARQTLQSDPDTVAELCKKLGIDDGTSMDDEEQDDGK